MSIAFHVQATLDLLKEEGDFGLSGLRHITANAIRKFIRDNQIGHFGKVIFQKQLNAAHIRRAWFSEEDIVSWMKVSCMELYFIVTLNCFKIQKMGLREKIKR